ncbi:hypothetical protein HGB07_10120 [Candidatus Roizmanbacteria bacterium]|nr:hypothetical protein [Candidatus Roizmanbacteria bacterium]
MTKLFSLPAGTLSGVHIHTIIPVDAIYEFVYKVHTSRIGKKARVSFFLVEVEDAALIQVTKEIEGALWLTREEALEILQSTPDLQKVFAELTLSLPSSHSILNSSQDT